MALFKKVIDHTLKWEGGLVDHPADPGGLTNMGIIWKLFQQVAEPVLGIDASKENLRNLTVDQAIEIYEKVFWPKIMGNALHNQNVANLLFDSFVNLDELKMASGRTSFTSIKMVQESVGADPDGKMGPKTLQLINTCDGEELFNDLKIRRIAYYKDLVDRKPQMNVFLKGWLKRVDSFKYGTGE